MRDALKLSAPESSGCWEVPVLFEDEHLLVLDKPARLLTSRDRNDPARPSLLHLLHLGIAAGAGWAQRRQLTYLANAHRLDFAASGVLVLAKTKPVLIALANCFGVNQPLRTYVTLVHGAPGEAAFHLEAKIAPHPEKPGAARIDSRLGKHARTEFTVRERFRRHTLLECRPRTDRPHQIRVHLQYHGVSVVGDETYGGQRLLLSSLKSGYRLKPKHTERPLLDCAALHAEAVTLPHPVTGATLTLTAPWPKDLTVAVKYLRRYAALT